MDFEQLRKIPKEDLVKLLRLINGSHSHDVCEEDDSFPLQEKWCRASFDSVLCWPNTPPNTLALLSCFDQLNGIRYDTSQNASRLCLANGTWDEYTDYSSCNELNQLDSESSIEVTTTIYFVGYTISLVALVIALYIFLKYKDLRCLRNTIHMNLMATYVLADAMWILTYILQVSMEINKGSCIFLIILLHYFHLTNFFWMFVEGLYLYVVVVRTFRIEICKIRLYSSIGWGLPIIIVALWAIAKSFALTPEDQQAGATIRSCPWTPHMYDWIYQGPAITVLIVNFIFLFVIMWVLIIKLKAASGVETQQYRKAAKALLVLIPLLGVTHILVILGPTDGISKHIYDNVRALLLSTQGLTVAILYCFVNTEVKTTVRHHFNSWHTRRTIGSHRRRYGSSRDWSPRYRESLRIFKESFIFKKRESTCSEGTTTSLVTIPMQPQGTKKSQLQTRSPLNFPGEFE